MKKGAQASREKSFWDNFDRYNNNNNNKKTILRRKEEKAAKTLS